LWHLGKRVKILFRICSDCISGSGGGGSESAAKIEAVGEERGEGSPSEDIVGGGESGFRQGLGR
jgi:hypothetical protein